MLLAGLQGHAQRGVATGIARHADDAPRHGSLVVIAAGEIGRVGAAIAHRYAKALGRAQHHIGTQLPRRCQHHQAEQVGGYAGQGMLAVQMVDLRAQVAHLAVGIRVLQQGPENRVFAKVIHRVDDQLEAEALGTGLEYRQGLRVTVLVGEEGIALVARHPLGQGHGLGGGGGFVEQRGIGQGQPGEVDDHLLEVQQRLQPALGNLGLIRRVGGVPARVFQHVAQDDRGGDGAVVAHADQAGPDLVLPGVTGELGQGGLFVQCRRQVEGAIEADVWWYGLLDQLTAAGDTQRIEHGLLLRGIRAQVATQEWVELLQLMQGWRLGHDDALFLDQLSWRLTSLGRDCRFCGETCFGSTGPIAGKPAPTGNHRP
ncbi:hypothetical protein D3C79_579930 [compost metagenome]